MVASRLPEPDRLESEVTLKEEVRSEDFCKENINTMIEASNTEQSSNGT